MITSTHPYLHCSPAQVSVPSDQVHQEFSTFGEVVRLFGELGRRGGRVSVAYRDKDTAIEAFLTK